MFLLQRLITISFIFLWSNCALSSSKLDSLWSIWEDNSNHDTTRLIAIGKIAWKGYLFTDPDSAFSIAQLQYEFAEKVDQKKYMAKALNTQGVAYYFQGKYADAIKSYEESYAIYLSINLKGGAASIMNNIGLIYQERGDFTKALDYALKSKEIYQEMGSSKGVASALNNLGLIYENQGAYIKATECYSKSIRIHEEMENIAEVVNGYINLGNIYKAQKDYKKAINYYFKSIRLLEKNEDFYSEAIVKVNLGLTYLEMGMYGKALMYFNESLELQNRMKSEIGAANVYINIALLYQEKKDFEKALYFYNKCLPIFEENEDQEGIAIVLNNKGSIFYQTNRIEEGLKNCKQSLEIAEQINSSEQIRNAAKTLWKLHKKAGEHRKSLNMHELYISYRDTITSEENKKELFKQEIMMEHEKQIVADSIRNHEAQKIKDAQLAQEKAENEKQKILLYLLVGGFVVVAGLAFFIFNRLRVTREQKKIIELQKSEVDLAYDQLEMKNQEITDSITYAKRIQTAILPSESYFKKHFPDSFIIYKPKDIVAGDFYWMNDDENKLMLAVADCTGHGVPGAMVSVICNHGLSHAVKEYQLTDPGQILDKTRNLVLEEFDKSSDAVNDGMDIAFVSVKYKYLEGVKIGADIEFAGAYNPIWIVKDNSVELIEIKGDKQPIGKHKFTSPFTTHKISLKKNDCFYLLTDGFADQFGGERGKKLKTSNFKNLILSYKDLPIENQGEKLNEFFENWGKVHEQIDDVCVIGIRV